MNQPPAFQFYVDNFIQGTCDMEQEEVGAYMRLLCYQWSNGSIPKEKGRLLRVAGGDVSDHVLAKFELCPDGELRNRRMEKERTKQIEYRQNQSEFGKMGGRPKKGSLKGTHKGSQSPPSPSPSPTPIPDPDLRSPSTPIPPFDRFWLAYPRRTAKAAAERAWKKSKLDGKIEEILTAIETQKGGWEWQKDNGQFIPHPATWLNQARWLDEIKPGFQNGTHQQNHRNGTRPASGAEQRTLGIPEQSGPSLSELLRRKRQSRDTLAAPADRPGSDNVSRPGDGDGGGALVQPSAA